MWIWLQLFKHICFLKIANTLVNLNNKTKTSNFQIISINIHSIFVLFSVWEVYLCPIIWKCYIVTKNRGNHSMDIYTQLPVGWLPMFEVNNRLTSYLWTSRSLQLWLIITYIRNVPDVYYLVPLSWNKIFMIRINTMKIMLLHLLATLVSSQYQAFQILKTLHLLKLEILSWLKNMYMQVGGFLFLCQETHKPFS